MNDLDFSFEASPWEEYLQEDGTDSGMTPERSFVKMRMEQAMAVLLTFVITNIFYVIIFKLIKGIQFINLLQMIPGKS